MGGVAFQLPAAMAAPGKMLFLVQIPGSRSVSKKCKKYFGELKQQVKALEAKSKWPHRTIAAPKIAAPKIALATEKRPHRR